MPQSETIWLVSDTHFGHENIIEYCGRPFSSVEEMNETLVEEWNAVVSAGDRVYHLGDFQFVWAGQSEAEISQYAARLNGQIFLMKGNHDRLKNWPDSLKEQFAFIRERYTIKGPKGLGPGGHPPRIFCSHYPHRSWHSKFHGVLHAFGHVHSDLDGSLQPGTLDVGVDSAYQKLGAFRPFSLEEYLREVRAEEYWSFIRSVKHEENAEDLPITRGPSPRGAENSPQLAAEDACQVVDTLALEMLSRVTDEFWSTGPGRANMDISALVEAVQRELRSMARGEGSEFLTERDFGMEGLSAAGSAEAFRKYKDHLMSQIQVPDE